jgi:hypothetical protein
VAEDGFPLKRLEPKKKITANPQQVVDWTFAERARR